MIERPSSPPASGSSQRLGHTGMKFVAGLPDFARLGSGAPR